MTEMLIWLENGGVICSVLLAMFGIMKMFYGMIGRSHEVHGGDPMKVVALNRHILLGLVLACIGFAAMVIGRRIEIVAWVFGVLAIVMIGYALVELTREMLGMEKMVKRGERKRHTEELEREIFGGS